MKSILISVSVSVAVFLLALPLQADVTVVMTHEANSKTVETTLSFAGERVRMDSAQGGVILTPAKDEMVILMHGQKQFMKRSLQETAAMPQHSVPVSEQISFRKTGEQQEINGYSCQQVIGTEPDGDVTEFWVSPDSVHTDKFLSAMQAFNRIQNNPEGGNQFEAWTQFFNENPELSTFPIRTINKNASGVVESVSTVKSISESAIESTRFEIPAGYAELTMGAASAPAGVAPSAPSAPRMPHPDVLKELQALQQEIQKNGGQPTPAQMKRLQELATQYQVQ